MAEWSKKMDKLVYLDNSATTKVSQSVLNAMLPFYAEAYGNASSVYKLGRESKVELEKARAKVAKALGAQPSEIYFTGCGTESDNWAIKGGAYAMRKKGKTHLITTNFEHHAVSHTMEALEKQGFEVTYLPVNSEGLITAEDVANAITDKTALVSLIYANNEIGTVLPIAEIGKVCREKGVLFHTDAVQAIGNVKIDVQEQNIDMLALTGHKIHAPKGVGALYIRKGVRIDTFMDGGAQEMSKRAGTENVASIVALGQAMEDAYENFEESYAAKKALTDKLIDSLTQIPHSYLNGSREHRLPTICNLSFEGVEGEALLLMLDMKGIAASSGSACTSGSLDPSHVLMAIGRTHTVAHGSLRLSVGKYNTEEEIDYVIKTLPEIIEKLRSMSPIWEKIVAGESYE